MDFGKSITIPITDIRDLSLVDCKSKDTPALTWHYNLWGIMEEKPQGWNVGSIAELKDTILKKKSVSMEEMFIYKHATFARASIDGADISQLALSKGIGSQVDHEKQKVKAKRYYTEIGK